MSKPKTKEKLNLKLPKDRWQFCREVQVPDHYYIPGKPDPHMGKPSEPTKIKVAPSITKSVLLDLAQYDWPGNTNYKGNSNVSHGTGLPPRSVSKGISVLKSIGGLERTFQGVKKTAISRLNWAVLDKLREPFRGEGTAPIATDDEDISDDLDGKLKKLKADDAEDDVSDLGPRVEKTESEKPAPERLESEKAGPLKDLVDRIMEFGPYRQHRQAVEIVVKGLLKKNKSPEEIQAAWASLKTDQRAMAVKAGSLGAYLFTMLTNAINQPPGDDYGWDTDGESPAFMAEAVEIARAEGVHVIDIKNSDDPDMGRAFVKWAQVWLTKNAPEIEYKVDHDLGLVSLAAPAIASK